MASVNKVILVGNLGRDPEIRHMPSGEAVANLTVATTDKYKDKSGQLVEQTEWHRVSFFGRTAEVCGDYLAKGSQIYVEGSIRTRKYTDKEGVEKYATEIRGERMQMLGARTGGGSASQDTSGTSANEYSKQSGGGGQLNSGGKTGGFDDMDDIPFATASADADPMARKLERRLVRYR